MAARWYVVHTFAGYEGKVKANIEKQIETYSLQDHIEQVLLPTEETVEIKGTERKSVRKKIFTGYLFIKMDLTDDVWYIIRNTSGVTGFVGDGTRPTPLSDKEVSFILKRMGIEAPRLAVQFSEGEGVRIIYGPFANFKGTVKFIDLNKEKIVVLLNIFGRETPVELDFDQVEKI